MISGPRQSPSSSGPLRSSSPGGAIISTQNLGDGGNLVAVSLAHGLAIGLMVAALGHISGGHFNPAVTISMLATGEIGSPGPLATSSLRCSARPREQVS